MIRWPAADMAGCWGTDGTGAAGGSLLKELEPRTGNEEATDREQRTEDADPKLQDRCCEATAQLKREACTTQQADLSSRVYSGAGSLGLTFTT
jgi:hypothetical protein